MITTRRSAESMTSLDHDRNGGVALLERPIVNEVVSPIKEENLEEARERMQRNLDKLLNYDRAADQVEENNVKIQEIVDSTMQDDDIRPTSTTMQFGDGDIDQMYKEMNRAESTAKESYHLNTKGKLVIVLYSLAVMVILALIAINTGMLATLSGTQEAKTAELNAKIAQYNVLQEEIESISSNEYVINQAETVLDMVKR